MEPKNVTIPALKLVFSYLKVISIVDKVLLVILNKILCNIYSANLMGRGGGGCTSSTHPLNPSLIKVNCSLLPLHIDFQIIKNNNKIFDSNK